jgi:hypothetical protein
VSRVIAAEACPSIRWTAITFALALIASDAAASARWYLSLQPRLLSKSITGAGEATIV